MEQPTCIKIDNVEYIRKDSIKENYIDSEIRIVVLQRGFVIVGKYNQDGDKVTLENSSVIEYWGTTEGLGQLVNGPTSKTRLKYVGHIETHILGIVFSFTVNQSKWS